MSEQHDGPYQNQGGVDGAEARPGVAIVGMAGRFPGAPDVATFWENIKAGRDSVTRFSPDALEIPIDGADGPDYVCAKGMLDDVDKFDARFFGYLPKEAALMDPQHRVFLEMCWEALETAGLDPARYPGAVGVYAGCYMDTYVLWNLCSDEQFRANLVESIQVGSLQTELGNDKDYLATRVAFKLGLRGPAMTLQTACSTSLVAIATACQALESYACDAALAGGVTIVLPQKKGYFYKEGSMLSPDGRCRTFDEKAAGTVFSNGAAVLVLKRLEDAIADRDTIYAVIRGYATNNDGGDKVSYTAPSVEGQAEVIALALEMADIPARSIGLVEAHGTATPLGDPIEIGGLTKAYRRDTEDTNYCAIGSVKANLGHLDVASGAIGLIKTSLALHEKVLPPQINFSNPNPKINFAETPFYVNTALTPWTSAGVPRRAGVSSFGVGGTNAHIVVEEAPISASSVTPSGRSSSHAPVILPISAKTEDGLFRQAERLSAHFSSIADDALTDAAHTLQMGRSAFTHRAAVVARTSEQAAEGFKAVIRSISPKSSSPELVFVIPGQGAQRPGMARALYDGEPVFREVIDVVADTLRADPEFGEDLRDLLLWTPETSALDETAAGAALAQTARAQPALYAYHSGLIRLLEHWGLKADALIGHSIGEFAAAAASGVFSLEDGARFVAARGRLMQAMAPGTMLALRHPAEEIGRRLPPMLAIAAVNSPNVTVISGLTEDIDAFAATLDADGVSATALKTSHAFHSPMMDDAATAFADYLVGADLAPAERNIISTASGRLEDGSVFAEPAYWSNQIRKPVLFADAATSASKEDRIFVDLGPGAALSGMIRQTLGGDAPSIVSCGNAGAEGDAWTGLLQAAGDLWTEGADLDWSIFDTGTAKKTALPTYPFERQRHWIDPKEPAARGVADQAMASPAQGENAPGPVSPSTGESNVETIVRRQLDVIAAQLKAMGR
ncbi:MAG: type I polyketide synthase [Pseudomonadota bacterium]